MENKFVEKIIEEVFGKWTSVPVFGAISIIAIVTFIDSIYSKCTYAVYEGNVTSYKLSEIGIISILLIILSFVILNAFNLLLVYKKHHIRSAKKGKVGILIRFDAPTLKLYKEAERKFGDEFKNKVFSGFDVVFVPFLYGEIDYKEKSIVKILQKKRCLLLLNIGLNEDVDGGTMIYDVQINAVIIHKAYLDDVEKEFQHVFSTVLKDFQKSVFPSKEMVKRFRIAASELSLGCQYVIALSLFLNGEFERSENVLKALVSITVNSVHRRKIVASSMIIRYWNFMSLAAYYIEKYQQQCNDENSLDKMNEMLEKARECGGKTYDYCLNKAYYYVAKEQNSVKAKEYINICKQMKNVSQTWRYSEAFLKAYDNKAIVSVYSAYRRAFKTDYNLQDLIVFIEMVIAKQPERIGLYLALGILYNNVGDELLSRECFDQYLSSLSECQNAKRILKEKKLYG